MLNVEIRGLARSPWCRGDNWMFAFRFLTAAWTRWSNSETSANTWRLHRSRGHQPKHSSRRIPDAARPVRLRQTTLLRMISGFETPSEAACGSMARRHALSALPAQRKSSASKLCALPHLTVADNISFGLKMQKLPRAEIAQRVEQVTALVSRWHGRRKPSQLSVASGSAWRLRAPSLPARCCCSTNRSPRSTQSCGTPCRSNSSGCKKLGITFVFVTHDQEEALTCPIASPW